MVSANACSRAVLLGIATGIRSMTPLAALSWAASSSRVSLPENLPLSLLPRQQVSTLLLLSAGAEFVADKLPITPARTARGPLFVRIFFGGVVGAVGFAADEDLLAVGAVVGGLSAAWGSFAGLAVRTQLTEVGLPKVLAGVTGDLLAISLSLAAVLQRGSKVG
jgi:uncharacterized membrane protein